MRSGGIVFAVAAIIAIVGIAHAAAPVKGSKYSGQVTKTTFLKVTFKVSSSGKKVTSLRVTPSLPNSCGYGGPEPRHASKSARIKHGKFTAKVTDKLVGGAVATTATVTGKFQSGGKEKGTIRSVSSGNKSCNGSFAYTTTSTKSP